MSFKTGHLETQNDKDVQEVFNTFELGCVMQDREEQDGGGTEGKWSVLPARVKTLTHNGLSWVNTGLPWVNTGLSWVNTGLSLAKTLTPANVCFAPP